MPVPNAMHAEAEPDPVHQRVDDDLERRDLRRRRLRIVRRHARRRGLRRSRGGSRPRSSASSSCLRNAHFAGYSVSICLPSSKTAMYAVVICFWPSSFTLMPSLRSV